MRILAEYIIPTYLCEYVQSLAEYISKDTDRIHMYVGTYINTSRLLIRVFVIPAALSCSQYSGRFASNCQVAGIAGQRVIYSRYSVK